MNKIEIHKTLCDQLNDIYSRKNADYGDSFAKVRREVPNAILVRLMDKMERIKTLLLNGERLQVADEKSRRYVTRSRKLLPHGSSRKTQGKGVQK